MLLYRSSQDRGSAGRFYHFSVTPQLLKEMMWDQLGHQKSGIKRRSNISQLECADGRQMFAVTQKKRALCRTDHLISQSDCS